MDNKIFFSYGHDEYKNFVLKVQKYLEEQEGFQVFVDSDKLRTGDDWEYKLEQAIEKNNKMVFFITKHAARRPDGYCLNEISMALAHNKKVFPIMLEEHVLPLSLIRKQYLDLRSCIGEGGEYKEGIFEEQIKYLIEVLNSNNDLEHGDIQQKLIKRLKPIDFQSDYARHGRIIGREWVKDKVDQWLELKPKSKVLWITAEAGYGKSAISADLARHPKVMSVHFCNYNSPDTQDPRSVVKTLAYTLQTQQIDGYREEIQDVESEGKNAFELFRDLIANPLSKVKKEGSQYLFVIDALDETLGDEDLELITLLGSDEFHRGLPDFVKIIITSRPESKIKQAISKFNPLELEADRKENRDDCEKYIEVKLSEFNKDYADENEKLVDTIMKNSNANMLYLIKFFEDDTLDLSQPDKFPKDLREIYWANFRRITKIIDEYDEKLSPILEVILAYGEPIPKLLLQEILGLNHKTLLRKLNMFGSMIREDDNKLDLYHKSLSDWLVSEENEDYFIDVNDGNEKIYQYGKKLNPSEMTDNLLHIFSKVVNENKNYITSTYDYSFFKYFLDQKYIESFKYLFSGDQRLRDLYSLVNKKRINKLILYYVKRSRRISVEDLVKSRENKNARQVLYHYFGPYIPIMILENLDLMMSAEKFYLSNGLINYIDIYIPNASTVYHSEVIRDQFYAKLTLLLAEEKGVSYSIPPLFSMANSYANNGRFLKALELFEEIYNITLKMYGENHIDTQKALSDINAIKSKIY